MNERKEAWMRIVVGIVSGIVLKIWTFLIAVVTLCHWLYVVFAGKRNKTIAEFSNRWVSFAYSYFRYMTFSTNTRPFPFNNLREEVEKVDFKGK